MKSLPRTVKDLRFHPTCKLKLPTMDVWMLAEDTRCLRQRQKEMYPSWHSRQPEHKHILCQFFKLEFAHGDTKEDRWHLHMSGLYARGGAPRYYSLSAPDHHPPLPQEGACLHLPRLWANLGFAVEVNTVSFPAVCYTNIPVKIICSKAVSTSAQEHTEMWEAHGKLSLNFSK